MSPFPYPIIDLGSHRVHFTPGVNSLQVALEFLVLVLLVLIPRKHISPGQTGLVGHPAWPLRPGEETSPGMGVGWGRGAGRGRERERWGIWKTFCLLRINVKGICGRTRPSLLGVFVSMCYAWGCCGHSVTTRGDKQYAEDGREKTWKTPGSLRTLLGWKCLAQELLL